MQNKKIAAISHHSTGEITQEAAIFHIVHQDTIETQKAAIHAHITPQTIEWVVETGAFKYVARFNHNAAASKAASIANINIFGSEKLEISIIHFLIVFTTSHQAITAQENSHNAAITKAHFILIVFDQTAGHTLLATSLAHIFIAIYAPKIIARTIKIPKS